MGYRDDLEKAWRANHRKAVRSTLKRPTSLRGREFMAELTRLGVLTGDDRFFDAARAAKDHGIVNERLNFTRWKEPAFAERDAIMEKMAIALIRHKLGLGCKVRRACGEAAGFFGWPANSFEAAAKDLQKLYEKMGKKV